MRTNQCIGLLSERQSGIALPTILILLFVTTLLGIATLNTSVLEEKMSSNFRMRQIAFNAAESALTFGEAYAVSIKDNIRGGNLPLRDGGTTQLYVPGPLGNGVPDINQGASSHLGNTCTGGYCIPLEFHQGLPVANNERWEDTNINVWNDDTKHLLYTDFSSTGLNLEGVFETPKYIIEYLGNYPIDPAIGSDCGVAVPPWPYCDTDTAQFRITARAMAGFPGQEIVVILQSTIKVP